MADPAIPACLNRLYSSKPEQRGGTLIAEDVTSLEEHRQWMSSVDGYRPEECGHCQGSVLHGHGLRTRTLRMEDDVTFAEAIYRFRCADCGGIWQVLPAVIARWLHRTWALVQRASESVEAVAGTRPSGSPRVPPRTVRRWARRLAMGALLLVQVVALSTTAVDVSFEPSTTRGEFVDALAAAECVTGTQKIAEVAEWLHRLSPGLRLM